MALVIDWSMHLIRVTSPTVSVTVQELADFIEDASAEPEGLAHEVLRQFGAVLGPAGLDHAGLGAVDRQTTDVARPGLGIPSSSPLS